MTSKIEEPSDFLGNIFAKIIGSYLENSSDSPKIENWKMDVTLETNFYAISLVFDNGLTISRGEVENPTLKLKTDMDTIIVIAKEKMTPLSAIIRRKIKVKGLLRHPVSAYRVYKLISGALGG